MTKLKVFGGLTAGQGKIQVRTIIATTSKKRAAELLDVSITELSNYWCVTGNPIENALALENPEVIFQASNSTDKDFIRATASPVVHGE